jgi:hypothetical protein
LINGKNDTKTKLIGLWCLLENSGLGVKTIDISRALDIPVSSVSDAEEPVSAF